MPLTKAECPFCGEDNWDVNYDGNGAYVACNECGAQGPANWQDIDDPDETIDQTELIAIKDWKTRNETD